MEFFSTPSFNKWVSIATCAAGLLLPLVRPGSLRPKFVRLAFLFWMGHWVLLAGVYTLFESGSSSSLILNVADAECCLIAAFFACYVFGDALRRRKWGLPLWTDFMIAALLILLVSSLVVNSISLKEPSHDYFKAFLRIALPVLLGTISVVLGGLAFLLRYGGTAHWAVSLLVLLYILAYGLAQLPAYAIFFALDPSHDSVRGANATAMGFLGMLKFLKAGLGFYFFFFIRPFWHDSGSAHPPKIYPPWEAVPLPRARTGAEPRRTNWDVFLSYCEEDSEFAQKLAEMLEERGQMCWYYKRDSRPQGTGYLDEMRQAVQTAKHFVLILSLSSLESHAMAFEIAWARERNLRIRPVLIDMDYQEVVDRRPTWSDAIGDAVRVDGKDIGNAVNQLRDAMGSPARSGNGSAPPTDP